MIIAKCTLNFVIIKRRKKKKKEKKREKKRNLVIENENVHVYMQT